MDFNLNSKRRREMKLVRKILVFYVGERVGDGWGFALGSKCKLSCRNYLLL